MENFFGHLKEEALNHRLTPTFQEACPIIEAFFLALFFLPSHAGHLGFFDMAYRHDDAVPAAGILQVRQRDLIFRRLAGPQN